MNSRSQSKDKQQADNVEKQTETLKEKHVSIYDLKLTRYELLHLRDLFSVCVQSEGQVTVSQSLARLEDRPIIEQKLWQKISKACQEMNIQVGESAPDYLIVAISQPTMGVFQVASDPPEQQEEECILGIDGLTDDDEK